MINGSKSLKTGSIHKNHFLIIENCIKKLFLFFSICLYTLIFKATFKKVHILFVTFCHCFYYYVVALHSQEKRYSIKT